MKIRSRRLVKKLHRRWLDVAFIDISLSSHWRTRLFDSLPGQVFQISPGGTAKLPDALTAAIERYGLRFSASVVSADAAEPWLSQGGCVVFKFWATDFPSVNRCTGNNPARR